MSAPYRTPGCKCLNYMHALITGEPIPVRRCESEDVTGYTCSLPEGHQGHHMACGLDRHCLSTWINYAEEAP